MKENHIIIKDNNLKNIIIIDILIWKKIHIYKYVTNENDF
jgi:hypothetical protein